MSEMEVDELDLSPEEESQSVDEESNNSEEADVEPFGIFDLHHAFNCHYPLASLVKVDEGHTLQLLKTSPDTRHKPAPLIKHQAVIDNTDYNATDTYSYVSLTEALEPRQREFIPAMSWIDDIVRFQADMEALATCNGETHLYFALARQAGAPARPVTDLEFDNLLLYIRRITTLFPPSAHDLMLLNKNSEDDYRLTYGEFKHLRICVGENRPLPAWYTSMLDLLFGSSDRALHHRATYLASQHKVEEEEGAGWLPDRTASDMYLAILHATDGPIDPGTLEEDYMCPICWRSTGEIDCEFRQMRGWIAGAGGCLCSNIYCEDCLSTDASIHGWESVCPKCRDPVFLNNTPRRLGEIKQAVRFGIDGDTGCYVDDERYTFWENLERSFADVDQSLAREVDDEELDVDLYNGRRKVAWDQVVLTEETRPGTKLDDGEDLELDPVFYQEFRYVQEAVMRYRITPGTRTLTFAQLYGRLWRAVTDRLWEAFSESPPATLISDRDLLKLKDNIEHKDIIRFRAGFLDAVKRMLNRHVNFFKYRICSCEGISDHTHGEYRRFISTWHGKRRPLEDENGFSGPKKKQTRYYSRAQQD